MCIIHLNCQNFFFLSVGRGGGGSIDSILGRRGCSGSDCKVMAFVLLVAAPLQIVSRAYTQAFGTRDDTVQSVGDGVSVGDEWVMSWTSGSHLRQEDISLFFVVFKSYFINSWPHKKERRTHETAACVVVSVIFLSSFSPFSTTLLLKAYMVLMGCLSQ